MSGETSNEKLDKVGNQKIVNGSSAPMQNLVGNPFLV